MKQSITETMVKDAFINLRPDNFTYGGLSALFEYLEQYEEDCDDQIDFDVIALCCDYSQMTLSELQNDYDHLGGAKDLETLDEWAEFLNDYTSVIDKVTQTESIIIQLF